MLKNIIKSSVYIMLLASTTISADEPISTPKVVNSESISEAYEMLETMHMDKTYKKMIDRMIGAQAAILPPKLKEDKNKMEKYNKIMKDFLVKYVSWDKVSDDMAKLYAKYYTTEELRHIKAFYLTPVGQKTLRLMPKLVNEGMQLSQSKIMPHIKEMQEEIMELMKEDKK